MSAHLFPPNTTPFEKNFALAFARISAVSTPARDFNQPQIVDASILPFLAWEHSVDEWDRNWSEEQKRNVIVNAYELHCYKGTIKALEQAITSLDLNITVREWFNQSPKADPYTFEVFLKIEQEGMTEQQYKKLIKIINAAKNVRSHWSFGDIFIISHSNSYAIAAVTAGYDMEYQFTTGGRHLNGDWSIDGTYLLNGVK
ncbi:phage tail protein I [Acinetobacter qingfengensis]|uniref:Phage tail protein I n=1 Tax=Acinetobacter qingfengensis TaxID=1262585 RepID=A0A1E7RBV3_9GAMM|nr:phage tail protein I [Acinetobacter qingfengensis]KAA8734913.1 phage tail protein I [Acinetobacter qingfengensis]OEY96919.1 phage tail protein I [Acinetobacter qingfengensis]